jgi:two-component system, OmpR family, sensor kinase
MADSNTTNNNTDAQRIATLEAAMAAVRAEMQDFSYTVSHDLRASLRHILSYAQLVQEDAAALLPPETMGFVNTIADSARHMGVLMDGLMELARLGTVAVTLAPVSLQALVQDVLAELRQKQPPPQAQLQWQVQQPLPMVLADAALLRAALLAVLDNAVKFTAHKALRQIAVSVSASDADGRITLQVQDNGVGFNPALQSQLFKPFSRLHSIQQFAGIGMGLALTRKMLERMGAQVQAQAEVDQGCSVRITLTGC